MRIKILNIRFETHDAELIAHKKKQDLAAVYIGKIIEIDDDFSSKKDIEKVLCKIISHETGWMVFSVNFKILDDDGGAAAMELETNDDDFNEPIRRNPDDAADLDEKGYY